MVSPILIFQAAIFSGIHFILLPTNGGIPSFGTAAFIIAGLDELADRFRAFTILDCSDDESKLKLR